MSRMVACVDWSSRGLVLRLKYGQGVGHEADSDEMLKRGGGDRKQRDKKDQLRKVELLNHA